MSCLQRLRPRDERGSLPLAMMLTLVGMSLSTLMVPIVISQVRNTASTMERSQALHAAQAGIDVALGGLRLAAGDFTRLKCVPPPPPPPAEPPVLGSVGAGLPGRYTFSIEYQNAVGAALPCTSSLLPVPPAPSLAVITSRGTSTVSGPIDPQDRRTRTLQATYVFRLTNGNVEGGLVSFTGGNFCLDAGSGTPTVGANVTTQPCNPGSRQQTFAYTPYLTLQLVSSKTAANPSGMCIDSGVNPVSGTLLRMQRCGSLTLLSEQRWSLNDSSSFQNTTPDGLDLGTLCMHARTGGTPGALMEVTACGGTADNTRTFAPEETVGAGGAGAPYQLVNFKQFGRCVDVTNFDTTLDLIVWPCKQAPNPVKVAWNQRFSVPIAAGKIGTVSGRITTYDNTRTNKTYCLTTFTPGGATHFVAMRACPTGVSAAAEWQVSYQEATYGTSYVIKDTYGRCLTPTNLDDPALPAGDIFNGSSRVSKLTTAVCDSSKLQKWNAPANIGDPSPLKNIAEK